MRPPVPTFYHFDNLPVAEPYGQVCIETCQA